MLRESDLCLRCEGLADVRQYASRQAVGAQVRSGETLTASGAHLGDSGKQWLQRKDDSEHGQSLEQNRPAVRQPRELPAIANRNASELCHVGSCWEGRLLGEARNNVPATAAPTGITLSQAFITPSALRCQCLT
jgi:hypothetical protein